ncbi:MAG: sugar ABC transporter substrate-binding protein [Acidimicrobiales bacterium]
MNRHRIITDPHGPGPNAGSNRRRSRIQLAAAVAALLALLATACGGDDDSDSAATDGGGGASGEITVWAMGAEGEQLGEFAEEFMAENPDITVNVDPLAWDVAHERLITAIAGDEAPDVSQMGTTWMGEFASIGALAEVPDDVDMDAYFEGARDTAIVDEVAYGVPWYVETRLLYYRTDLAEQAGITEPPGDWDELRAMAEAMQQQAGSEWGIYLQPGQTGAWQTFMPFFWQRGGDILADDSEFALDSPEMVEAVEFYQSFYDDGLSPSSVPEGFDITPAFVQGTHPMFFSGPWHMSLIEDLGGADIEGRWAVAPMPQEESGTSFVGGSDLVVFEGSDNSEAAWEFVRWLSTPEVQGRWYEAVSALPAVESAWQEGELASDDNLAIFGDQLSDAIHPPAISTWEQIATEIDGELERVAAGEASPEDAAQAMQESASSIGVG